MVLVPVSDLSSVQGLAYGWGCGGLNVISKDKAKKEQKQTLFLLSFLSLLNPVAIP